MTSRLADQFYHLTVFSLVGTPALHTGQKYRALYQCHRIWSCGAPKQHIMIFISGVMSSQCVILRKMQVNPSKQNPSKSCDLLGCYSLQGQGRHSSGHQDWSLLKLHNCKVQGRNYILSRTAERSGMKKKKLRECGSIVCFRWKKKRRKIYYNKQQKYFTLQTHRSVANVMDVIAQHGF